MRICIFGASSSDIDPVYIEKTFETAKTLAERGHSLMFGGGANGLMGAAARGFTEGGGHIIGVAPRFFDRPGILYQRCDEFVYPDSMRDRKKYMEDNSDAFLITPGGIGTYEEFFEVLTLKQLARHAKPIVVFNILGYYDPLLSLLQSNIRTGFVRGQTETLFACTADTDEAVRLLETDAMDIGDIRYC